MVGERRAAGAGEGMARERSTATFREMLGFFRTKGFVISCLILALAGVLLIVEYFGRKWLWWNVPFLRLMHCTKIREDGTWAVFDRECYSTLLIPVAQLLVVYGVMLFGVLAFLFDRAVIRKRRRTGGAVEDVTEGRRKPNGWVVWAALLGLLVAMVCALVSTFFVLKLLLGCIWQLDMGVPEYGAGLGVVALVCVWYDIRRRRRLDPERTSPAALEAAKGRRKE